MLQVQEAVKRSLSTFAELFSDEARQDLRLEEVRLSSDDSAWLVTVSYKNPDYEEEKEDDSNASPGLAALMGNISRSRRRKQKTIKLRTDTGDLVGIQTQWEN